MIRPLATIAISFVLFTAIPAWAFQSSDRRPKQETKKKAGPAAASLTGCIDEREGHYILVDDRALAAIANLEAEGFPPEGFAKYMGHKVTVRGTARTEGSTPIFRVRKIETVSETCAPEQ
jgi:hypothetical protein